MSRAPQPTLYLDFLFPVGASHVTAKELAGVCGYTPTHILAAIDSGNLGAFQIPGRGTGGKKGKDKRLHARIPIALARAYLLAHSTGLEDPLILDQFSRAAAPLPRHLKVQVWQEINRQLNTAK